MNLEDHYHALRSQSLQKFRNNDFEFDPLIDSENDSRYGITLLGRPSREVKQNISKMLNEIKAVAPNQYYYPESDLHVTILSIISCYAGFSLDQIDQSDYQKIVQSAIGSISPFKITFCGLTASPSCILVQGFPENNKLDKLRNILRNKFKQSSLQHSIDKRYQLKTAHLTVVRFKKPIDDVDNFIKTVTSLRDVKLGSSIIDKVELVGNDWYQQHNKVTSIAKYHLGKQTIS